MAQENGLARRQGAGAASAGGGDGLAREGDRRRLGVILGRPGRAVEGDAGQQLGAVPGDALGIGAVEWQSDEELGRHAAALAGVVAAARRARTSGGGLAQLLE